MDRTIHLGGVAASSPAGLAHLLREAHAWRGSFARWLTIAEGLWTLPDASFGFEVSRTAMNDPTKGLCTTCGVGYVPYLYCDRDDCRWLADPNFSPSPEWSTTVSVAMHKQQASFDTGAPFTPPELNGKPAVQSGWTTTVKD